jgi:hypothetical protein
MEVAMAHRMSKKERKAVDAEQDVRKQMMRMARTDLRKAMEWIDGDDVGWALTMVLRAEKCLEAARSI